jgi:hypothetical protein
VEVIDEVTKLKRRSVLRKGGPAMFGAGAIARLDPHAMAQHGGTKAAAPPSQKGEDCNCTVAADGSPLDIGTSEIQPAIERYDVELRDLNRVHALPGLALRQEKLNKFYADQLQLLEKVNFDALAQLGKVDYLLLRARLRSEQAQLANQGRQDAEVKALIPFQQTVIAFEEALHTELVGSGKMTDRAFHGPIYREGNMPVEMVRLAVNGQKVTRDYQNSWKFYGSLA